MSWLRDWAEVIGALATAAAVVVAVAGIIPEARARKRAEARAEAAEAAREAERERADELRSAEEAVAREERRRAQGLQVIAWVEKRPATKAQHDETGERALREELVVHYVNQSPSPLFDLRLAVFAHGYNEQTDVTTISVVPGNSGGDALPDDDVQRNKDRTFSGVAFFRDLQGVHWRRDENGLLREVDQYGALR